MRRRLLYLLNETPVFFTPPPPPGRPAPPPPRAPGRRRRAAGPRPRIALARLIARLRPDMVHHVSMKPVLWGGLVSRLLRVPAAVFAVTGLGYLFVREDAAARLLQA